MDPTAFEVLKNALLNATEEMAYTIRRTAYSANIKTRADFSCAFFDTRFRVIAQSFSQPPRLSSMKTAIPNALREYGPDRLGPGDGLILNDPHRGSSHLNDVALIAPVYAGKTRIGYLANMAHHVDVGGSTPSSLGVNREIYQEGIIIPPTRIMRRGEIDTDVLGLILQNVRAPHETGGDLRAQMGANLVGAERIAALVGRHSIPRIEAFFDELLDYTERWARREIAGLPEGTYRAEGYRDGNFHPVKVSSTPDDPSQAFMEALTRTPANRDLTPEQVRFVVHGATVATNTIIQQKGARVGLIASEGFSDLFEIAWQIRPNLYDLFYDNPPPLVPRHLCIGVPERLDAHGNLLVPLDENAVRRAARKLVRSNVEAILICFLHAYKDPANERRAAEIIREQRPELPVCISSDVCPEYREYTRASTTAVNAALLPAVGAYIERLEGRLQQAGLRSGLFLMTSGGGIIASGTARQQPVQLIESGPAAGVIAAAFIGQLAGFKNLIALDIGGTTAKAALKGERRVHMPGSRRPVATAIYDRYRLRAGNRISGPAIVEEIDSTTLIPPGCNAKVDGYGNLAISVI